MNKIKNGTILNWNKVISWWCKHDAVSSSESHHQSLQKKLHTLNLYSNIMWQIVYFIFIQWMSVVITEARATNEADVVSAHSKFCSRRKQVTDRWLQLRVTVVRAWEVWGATSQGTYGSLKAQLKKCLNEDWRKNRNSPDERSGASWF